MNATANNEVPTQAQQATTNIPVLPSNSNISVYEARIKALETTVAALVQHCGLGQDTLTPGSGTASLSAHTSEHLPGQTDMNRSTNISGTRRKTLLEDSELPAWIDYTIAEFLYVPYFALSRAAKNVNLNQPPEKIVLCGHLVSINRYPNIEEADILLADWKIAAPIAVRRTRHYHGDTRADALASHHRIVLEINGSYDWEVAVQYDFQQRAQSANNHQVDISILNEQVLLFISTKIAVDNAAKRVTAPYPMPTGNQRKRARRRT